MNEDILKPTTSSLSSIEKNQALTKFVSAIDALFNDELYVKINYFLKHEALHAYGFEKFLYAANNYKKFEDSVSSLAGGILSGFAGLNTKTIPTSSLKEVPESIRADAESELEKQMEVINENIAKNTPIAALKSAYKEGQKGLNALEKRLKTLQAKDDVDSILEVL